MAMLFVPSQLRSETGGRGEMEVHGETLGAVLRDVADRYPSFVDRVLIAGQLAPGLAVAIDGAMTNRGLMARVLPDSEIHFLPAIGAG